MQTYNGMEKSMASVILPGSYDPVTLGHLDMIKRASEMYDEVYAVIFVNPEKSYSFSLDERVKMLMLATDDMDNVLVSYSNGLVIDYMREHDIEFIIKGYRNEKDLEYERRQAEWNLKHGGYDTLLWEADSALKDVSSTRVRAMIRSGEELSGVLPEKVISFLKSH